MDVGFLNRLRCLQRLCDSRNGLPHGLLFVNGADGKNNKGAHCVMKYLFFGAVGNLVLME